MSHLELTTEQAAQIAEWLIDNNCELSEGVSHYFGTSAQLTSASQRLLHAEVFRCTVCQYWRAADGDESATAGLCLDCDE